MAQWQQSLGCQNDPPDGQFQCYTIYKMSAQVDAEVPKLPLELVPDAWVVSEQLQQAAQKDFGAIKTWVNGQYFFLARSLVHLRRDIHVYIYIYIYMYIYI